MAQTTTLITGANKGLGYEAARRLLGIGHRVWLGARDAELGRAAAAALGAEFVQIDVTDQGSVEDAVAVVANGGGLDVLINNAGILGADASVAETTPAELEEVFATNVFGVVRVLQAFSDLLERSPNPVVVNVSSGLGSLGLSTRGGTSQAAYLTLGYPASKAALNMLTVKWAAIHPRWRVNAANPGFTATDLNGNTGTQNVTEGTDAIVELACVGLDGPTGTLISRDGPVPW
jgi:NAD(P)-dependent dehydrogenase (short-subunit alcohol dehydrogenase family)